MCLCTYLELNAVFLTPSSRLESKSRHITPVQRLIKLAEWQLYWPWLRNSSDHPPQCVCRMKVDGLANGLRRRRNYHHLLDPLMLSASRFFLLWNAQPRRIGHLFTVRTRFRKSISNVDGFGCLSLKYFRPESKLNFQLSKLYLRINWQLRWWEWPRYPSRYVYW